jgi:hypothetical protein
MDKAFAWIGYIVEWLGQFFPRWKVIPTTHGWIKWVRGFKVKVGGPGIVWWWPATTEIEGYPVAVSGMLVYEVSDIEKLLGHTFDPDDTVKDIAQSALTDVLGHMSWPDIKKGQGKTLDTKLKNAAKKELEDYGVNVLKCSLTTLALCRVHRLITSQFTEGEVK